MEDNSTLVCLFGHSIYTTLDYIEDFEKIFNDIELIQRFPRITRAYSNIVVINLYQIIKWGSNDIFWIKEIKKIFPEKQKEIEDIENEFNSDKDMYKVININRNTRSGHLGNNSIEEADDRLYDPQILFNNLDTIKKFLEKLREICKNYLILNSIKN